MASTIEKSKIIDAGKTGLVSGGAAYGTSLLASYGFNCFVPFAMGKYGLVVNGVGTYHVSLASGGGAETLQALSAVCSASALPAAAIVTVGAACGIMLRSKL